MKFLVLDAETFWSKEYSLSGMTNEAYIRDPRFKLHGWGIQPVGGAARWVSHEQFVKFSQTYDWSDTAIVCHNTRFDGAILGWKYGVKPRLWVDTMGMYRALHPELKSHGLTALVRHFGLGEKGDALWSRGIKVLSSEQFRELGMYCINDCMLTEKLFSRAWDNFPTFERAVMDMTLRMFIEPILEVDQPVLQKFLDEHVAGKAKLLEQCGLGREEVMSSEKFARALAALDIIPPKKPSPSDKNKKIYAFAKTDAAMSELAEHPDPRVQVLVAARLGNKSTLLETRTRHVIEVGQRGTLPIPLNYWGAKVTGRHSGGGGLNMQNFTRGSVLRDGVVAPPGYKIVVGDSSNIELRLVMALAGQWDVVEKLRAGVDLYCDFASDIYGKVVTKADKDERFDGKTGMLSLQYMASGERYHEMLRQAITKENARRRAEDPTQEMRTVPSKAVAENTKDTYRRKHRKVVALWYYCDEQVIPAIAQGRPLVPVDVNGWFLTNGSGFALPGELGVQYPGLQKDGMLNSTSGYASENWSYDSGRGRREIYGAKCVENLCQHAARQVVMYQGLLVNTRYRVVHSVHDELVCCVPEDEAEDCASFMLACLQTAPKWTQGRLPVTGEVGIGDSYGAAK